MSDATKPTKQTTTPETSGRESLVPGVPADFILEAIRRIDQELAKLKGEGAEASRQGKVR